MGMWLVGASGQTFSFVQWLRMVPGGVSALASVAVPLLVGAICWGHLTAEDQVYSNVNSRSCEDELREILELSKLFAWYRWLAAILCAALWLIVATCLWSAVGYSSCSGAIPHAQCWSFFDNRYCSSLDLFCSRFEVGVDHLLQRPISFVCCVSAVHQISSTGIGMSPDGGEDGRGRDRGDRGESGLAVAEVHPGNGRPGGRAARNVIRDDARLLDDVAPLVLPTAAIGRGTISNSRNPQASELLPEGRLVVNFHDDPGWDRSRLFLELVREGRNPALCPRTSMGLTHDRDPTMMRDLRGRLFSVPLVTMGERVRRRIVRKLPVWRAAPANPPTPPRDPAAHVGTSLLIREPRQHASRTVGSSCFCV